MTVLLVSIAASAAGATFVFDTDPFAGSTALTTPGRQVVGGEPSISFTTATDTFVFSPPVFNIGNQILFANNVVGSLPTGGVNVIVLRTFDDDNNAATAFGAGNAANLIATQITSPGAGFFIYFNSGLDLPRLVYSTDLNDNTADLKIMARLINLTGQDGRNALAAFAADDFTLSPEPSSLVMAACAAVMMFALHRSRRVKQG